MPNRTKTYPMWLYWTEVSVILGIYIGILGSFYKYFFYTNLSGYHIFIYFFLIVTTLAFVFYLITLATGTYYNEKKKVYNNYIKQISSLKRKGKYCSPLKYTISLIVGFSFFLSSLGISGMIALKTKNEIFMIVFVIFILGLLGFIKSVRNGLFYSLLSKKQRRTSKKSVVDNKEMEVVIPGEDGITTSNNQN